MLEDFNTHILNACLCRTLAKHRW